MALKPESKNQRPSTQEIIELTESVSASNYHPLPVVISRAEGAWVTDPEGCRYLDSSRPTPR